MKEQRTHRTIVLCVLYVLCVLFYLRSIPLCFSKVLVPPTGVPLTFCQVILCTRLEEVNTLGIFILLQSKVLNASLHLQFLNDKGLGQIGHIGHIGQSNVLYVLYHSFGCSMTFSSRKGMRSTRHSLVSRLTRAVSRPRYLKIVKISPSSLQKFLTICVNTPMSMDSFYAAMGFIHGAAI